MVDPYNFSMFSPHLILNIDSGPLVYIPKTFLPLL